MTAGEREQVVELLRCAADVGGIAGAFEMMTGIDTTGAHYQPGGRSNYPVWDNAVKARCAIDLERTWLTYEHSCLEAAARIEEGWSPS